jgi:hypothetical protein
MKGDSEKQVALALCVSPHTVHVYVKALYRHYGVNSKGELLAKAFARASGTIRAKELRLNRAVRRIAALVVQLDPKAKRWPQGKPRRRDFKAQARLKGAVEKISKLILGTQVVEQPSPQRVRSEAFTKAKRVPRCQPLDD